MLKILGCNACSKINWRYTLASNDNKKCSRHDEPMPDECVDCERLTDAWKLVKAIPSYYHDPEESPRHFLSMGDVWAWACADCIVVTDENVERIARLYDHYGFAGLLYYCVEAEGYTASEFTDNNRMIQFVANEERIRKEVPDYNKRAYSKQSYTIDGEIEKARAS